MSRESFSSDGQWKVVVDAYNTNALVYRAIGAIVRVYQKKGSRRSILGIVGPLIPNWEEATDIPRTVKASYYNLERGGWQQPLYAETKSSSSKTPAESRVWSVGVGVTVPVDPNFNPSGVPSPAGLSQAINGVIASGNATINGEFITVEDVRAY